MHVVEDISVMDLTKTFARHFAKDFALRVMQQLQASHPVSESALESFLAPQVAALDLNIGSTNTINRFLFECAEYAVAQDMDDKTSYATWKTVSQLPSIHHDEIQALVFNSAGMYTHTVDKTVLNVIARDAHVAAESIAHAAQARTSQTETGGDLITFNWGVLNDGMWLNGALLKAYSLAGIFHPDDKVQPNWSQTAFDHAAARATMTALTDSQQALCYGELDMLIANCDDSDLPNLLGVVSQNDLNAMLFTIGALARQAAEWKHGMIDSAHLVTSVTQLSTLSRMINTLSITASNMEEGIISDLTKARLEQAYNVVVLSLVGYEALRETKFAETLIMSVAGVGNDPKVDVVVNADNASRYYSAGGEQQDLIHFGLYLDPRRGMPASGNGWSLSHIENRRDQVIPQIMAEASDRQEKLRNNDAAVIQDATRTIINGVVSNYLEARGMESLRPDIFQSINNLARKVTDPAAAVKLDEEIVQILTATLDDPFVASVTTRLIDNMSSEDGYVRDHAPSLTIAQSALADVVQYITDPGV